MTVRRQPSRLLLPKGSGRLRSDLGAFLKRRRQGRLDSEPFGTQAQIARRVGITRQTLSEIERGAAWPGPATLDALLDILDLGWEHVAHPIASGGDPLTFVNDMPGGGRLAEMPAGSAPACHRTFLEGPRGNQIIAFGEAIREARAGRGLTLVEAATAAGISAALLSRLERGQLARSGVFRFDDAGDGSGVPTLVITNRWLARWWSAATGA
jgi:transcriptional regulator with XRE-family HTH domain